MIKNTYVSVCFSTFEVSKRIVNIADEACRTAIDVRCNGVGWIKDFEAIQFFDSRFAGVFCVNSFEDLA